MKTQQILNSKYLKLALITLTAALMTACGTSKSNPAASPSTAYDFNSQKQLANCNKSKDSNFSINTANVNDQNGQISTDWIKMKFNFLSTTVTTSGNTIKFFKWQVIGGQSQLDNTPLQFSTYDLSTGQTVGATVNSMNTTALSPNYGLYIQLNDPNIQFQVLKAVIYDTSNNIVASMNTLIPGFNASPIDYQYNADGSARSITLQQLHPLYGQDVSAWTQTQLQQSYSQYCF